DRPRPKALKLQGLNKALVKALAIFGRKFRPWPSLRASRVYYYVIILFFSSTTASSTRTAMGLFLAQGQKKLIYVHVLPQGMCCPGFNWRRPVRRT
ncbi:hypothetical protein C8R45DRAFT_987870, partial [Mycena sanguinolenta]